MSRGEPRSAFDLRDVVIAVAGVQDHERWRDMKALVVYDSRSGYTEAIARAIGDALAGPLEVTVARVGEPVTHDLTELALLVVGGPTEAHGATPAMREWLDGLAGSALRGIPAAAFDTRLHWPKLLSGSAAELIAARLRKEGCHLVAKPESFMVQGKENPAPGPDELAHVAAWATVVLDAMAVPIG